jgi:hypothetical protein
MERVSGVLLTVLCEVAKAFAQIGVVWIVLCVFRSERQETVALIEKAELLLYLRWNLGHLAFELE